MSIRFSLFALISVLTPMASGIAYAEKNPSSDSRDADTVARPFRLISSDPVVRILEWDRQIMRDASADGMPVAVKDFAVRDDLILDLDLEPFEITSSKTKFVLGRKGQPDIPLNFDTKSISLFRGKVAGRPGSSVFLALGDTLATGLIELPGHGKYLISSKGRSGQKLAAGQISVFEPSFTASLPPGVELCGLDDIKVNESDSLRTQIRTATTSANVASAPPSTVGRKHIELAVETDYELWSLFGDSADTLAYVYAMFGAVSDIYVRDINTWVEVVYVRIWDDPNDLFNEESPLTPFRTYWESNMGAVQRDVAQFFSGRRDFPFGGQAYLNALCSNFGYGVVGYAAGFFPDPDFPSPYSYDIGVTAHELGHNFGTSHTHNYGIDTCDNPLTTPQRGTIMAYCSQTWSGMNANEDLWFHTFVRSEMLNHINSSVCVIDDCNMNSVADSTDIANLTSADTNFNGIPDECEDCNTNGTLDPIDIAGASLDLNSNGVPDECEPDCNTNGVPDDRDIFLSTSTDAYGNGIPDECEPDCNTNGTSDYTEIQLDITLDKNRNLVLDSCEDCNTNGTIDLEEINGAHFVWVASGNASEPLREFHPTVGVLTQTSTGSTVNAGQDVLVRPNGNVLVSSATDDKVLQFNSNGAYLGDFVTASSGGLNNPTGMTFSPSGTLLVSSRNTNSVLEYNGTTGAFIGTFVAAGLGGLVQPYGLTYDRDDNLYVASSSDEILKYNGSTGAFLGAFVPAGNNGTLSEPKGLSFKSDGNLLVASAGSNEVLEFEESTGLPLGKWAQVGTATSITQDFPWGIRVGPNGHVHVSRTGPVTLPSASNSAGPPQSHLTDARMFEYEVGTGLFRKTLIGGQDHGLFYATGFDFVNGDAIDCNYNQLQDSCDISSGTSLDVNTNTIPDECEIDCNSNTVLDRRDIIPFGTSYDCNFNFIPDECDIASGFSQDCDSSGKPDECEADCNGNGLGDACDVQSGFSDDCNNNGTPDECEPDTDCNNNGTADICDLFTGTSSDCNNNGIPDSCDADGGGLIADVDFESGLPSGWTTTGNMQVTGACATNPVCDGSNWAYAGNTGSCTYGDNQIGELISPSIALAQTSATLEYCTMVNTEADFDFATVLINGQTVSSESGTFGVWEDRVVDLTPFAGQNITVTFRFTSDGFVTEFGWQIDNIRITNGSEDCDANSIPDECDLDCDDDGIPDGCDDPGDCTCLASNPPAMETPAYAKNRYLSVQGNNPGQLTALRVTFVDLPAPYDVWNGTQMWVDEPTQVSELGGVADTTPPTYLSAGLSCTPGASAYQNWSALGTVHIHHEGIVPDGVYDIEEINVACLTSNEASFSAPQTITNAKWSDVVGLYDNGPGVWTAANGTVSVPTDVVAILDKFSSQPTAPTKPRVDIAPAIPNQIINVEDFSRALSAFTGSAFPYSPGAVPCP